MMIPMPAAYRRKVLLAGAPSGAIMDYAIAGSIGAKAALT
jgi:hypothetical protein